MPKISVKSQKKSAASGMLTAGGITRRSRSLGWSWWTPWMMKWRRSPPLNFGCQWKTSRCSQYSVRVQIRTPAANRPITDADAVAAVEAGPEPDRDDRHEQDRRDAGVHAREEVEEAVLEQRRRRRQLGCALGGHGSIVNGRVRRGYASAPSRVGAPAPARRQLPKSGEPRREGGFCGKGRGRRACRYLRSEEVRGSVRGATLDVPPHQRPNEGDQLAPSAVTARRREANPRRRKAKPSCADCYFGTRLLCALERDEPCTTFRPDLPDGLVPPAQPMLLIRADDAILDPEPPPPTRPEGGPPPLTAAPLSARIESGRELTVLGKSPAWQDAGGACSSYLVEEGEYRLLRRLRQRRLREAAASAAPTRSSRPS